MEKYDIISVVGEGSYGLVMRCRHRESGQYVAIKKFLETEDDPTVRKMALREIRMLKKLRHENLVNMIEVFRRKKRFFLVFEYLEHTVLEELEARSGGLGFITSRKYIYQVLRALDFIHSHDVIHRDIKPENVLVSRLGVIKLCDFGFARPYSENETFTDYVATRWYRSPELLVGDRYGKEVDIWAVGCLYCEMMTGEPLFPGESDIDQLFQIVRILGKLSSRHQILIMRNAMFRGMKQEQNTSLTQMFPNWNRDSIDFLSQCLKMDGNARPDTGKLLKHDLFVRDNFLDNFLSELRAKLAQEMQVNPLLKRIPSYGSNGRWQNNDEKKSSENSTKGGGGGPNAPPAKKSSGGDEKKDGKMNRVNLSVLSTQLLQPVVGVVKPVQPVEPTIINGTQHNKINTTLNGDLASDKINDELNKQHLSGGNSSSIIVTGLGGGSGNNNNNNNSDSNPLALGNDGSNKQIPINNLTFKDSNNKYARILSAKLNKSGGLTVEKGHSIQQSTSPIPFQSLQSEPLSIISNENAAAAAAVTLNQNKRLSPVTHITANVTPTVAATPNNQNVTNNSNSLLLNGQNLSQQYFNYRRHSNALGPAEQIPFPKNQHNKPSLTNQVPPSSQMPSFNVRGGGVMTKRDRSQNLIDATLKPLNNTITGGSSNSNTLNSILINDSSSSNVPSISNKDTSPRILPPPQWLTGSLKLSSQGKIGNVINANNGQSKRRITDWKSVGMTNPSTTTNTGTTAAAATGTAHGGGGSDLVLPNCPGAISPKKSNSNSLKKKLTTLSNIYPDSNLITPRNFSASSDHINET